MAVPSAQAQDVYHVTEDGDAGNSGSSFDSDPISLQGALDQADGDDVIVIAAGTYTPSVQLDASDPDSDDPRTATFEITGDQDGLRIYGGFRGDESFDDVSDVDAALDGRELSENETVFSGNINGNEGDVSGNAYHVLVLNGGEAIGADITENITGATVLNGVTVTDGNARGLSNIDRSGGGLYCDGRSNGNVCSPQITEVTFTGNSAGSNGGAILNDGLEGASSPQITGSTFTGNSADDNGGAIFNFGSFGASSPQVTNATFTGNSAGFEGGAIFNNGRNGESSPQITNATFTGNSAAVRGGAIFNFGFQGESSPQITNSTITGNSTDTYGGGAIYNDGFSGGASSPQITNSILWGNNANGDGDEIYNRAATPTLSYTLIDGGVDGNGIFDDNGSSTTNGDDNLGTNTAPDFVDADDPVGPDGTPGTEDDGLRLVVGSDALDAGDNTPFNSGEFLEDITTDLLGEDRIQDGDGDGTATVSLGAYERAEFVGPIYHVTEDGDPSNDGSSFANSDAIPVQEALARASSDDVIVIAAGTYTPSEQLDASDPRTATFEITGDQDGLRIYGGWAGTESAFTTHTEVENALDGRNLSTNATILSGDLNGDDADTDGDGIPDSNRGDNAYHVLILNGGNRIGVDVTANITDATVLDGVTVSGGNGDGNGGGLYCDGGSSGNECSPQVTNVTFTGNSAARGGGAIFNNGLNGGTSSPQITHAIFIGNSADQGGAVFNDGRSEGESSPQITGALFTGNSADDDGGAIYNSGAGAGGESSPQITGSTFTGNSADDDGGAIYNYETGAANGPVLTNTILWNNSATDRGDEIFNNGDDKPTLRYTLIDGGVDGDGIFNQNDSSTIDGDDNLDANARPDFVNADDPMGPDGTFGTEDDGLRLEVGSDALDVGDNAAVPSGITTDLLGEARIQNGTVSLGAYERGVPRVLHVRADATAGAGDGTSFDDAFTNLQDALNEANGGDVIVIAAGTYVPTSDPSDRNARFEITGDQDGIQIYGGFSGSELFDDGADVEDALESRNLAENETILSGNIDDDASTNAENSYNVVVMRATNNDITGNTVIDGFTIRDGNANDDQPEDGDPSDAGGGLHIRGLTEDVSPVLRNLRITENAAINGGGLYIDSFVGTAAPFLSNVIVTENNAEENGGGLYASASTGGITAPVWVNALFVANKADRGGAFYKRAISGGTVTSQVVNAHIVNNEATTDGGAAYHEGVNTDATMAPEYVNTVFWNNTSAPFGSEINDPGAGVPVFQHVLAEDGCPGGNTTCDTVLDEDPQLVNIDDPAGADGRLGTEADGLRFTPNAPLYNAGTDAPYGDGETAESITIDILGDQRIQDGTVNMGAYETALYGGPVFYVYADANGAEDGSSFNDAFTDLQRALQLARTGDAIVVAEGIYTPIRPVDPSGISEAEREATFRIDEANEGVQLYGGWNSSESFADVDAVIGALGSRSLTENRTILSGDIGGNSTTNSDGIIEQAENASDSNSNHVLTLDGSADPEGITPATVVDGFVITGGNLSGTGGGGTDFAGAGLFCNGADHPCAPRLSNLLVVGNDGGNRSGGGLGIVSQTPAGDPQAVLTNLVVSGNKSNVAGGGMAILGEASPQIVNTVFSANTGGGFGGAGAVYIVADDGSAPMFINTTFAENTIPDPESSFFSVGSAIVNVADDPGETELTLINSILWGNAGEGGSTNQIANANETTLRLQNTLVQEAEGEGITTEGSSTVLFLDTDGTAADFGSSTNLDVDPLFADASSGDLRLGNGSPAIARGTFAPFEEGGIAEGITTDLAGNARIFGARPDLGAYAFSDIAATSDDLPNASSLLGYLEPGGFEGLVLLRENPATTGGLTFARISEAPDNPSGELPGNVAPFTWTVDAELNVDPTYDLLIRTDDIEGIGDFGALMLYKSDDGGATWNTITDLGGALVLDEDRQLVAVQDLTGFSQFAIASTDASNPLPVELAGLQARRTRTESVTVQWQTLSETNNAGFEVQRATGSEVEMPGSDVFTWQTIARLNGAGTTDTPQSYRFEDADLPYAADSLSYRLRQIDTDGTASFSEAVTIARPVEAAELLPTYPNPARSTATVRFAVPDRQAVRIMLYDMLGRRVQTVVDTDAEGRSEQVLDVSRLASGTYFLRMQTKAGPVDTQRITVVR